MIILGSSTDKIQVVLTATVATGQLPCVASYRDTQSGATLVPNMAATNTNNTTAVDLVPSPAASTQRGVDFICINNEDTDTAEVTVLYNANGTTYTLIKSALGVGERMEYAEGAGWRVFANSGAVKTSMNQGATPVSSTWNMVVLDSDVVNNNVVANTIQDVTGLSFAVNSGTRYRFRAFIWYTAALTSTGSRWCIDGPASSNIVINSVYSLTATTQTTNHGIVGFDLPAACNTGSANVNGNTAVIEGELTASANGTVIVRFASEITASAITAKAGSTLEWIAVI